MRPLGPHPLGASRRASFIGLAGEGRGEGRRRGRLKIAGAGFAFLAALAFAACEERRSAPAGLVLTKVGFADLADWGMDRPAEAVPALRRSCERLARQPADRPVGPGGIAGTAADWAAPCRQAMALPEGDDKAFLAFLETAFVPFRVADGDKESGLFTGYYEPEMDGGFARDDRHAVPLYRRPPDLVTVDLGEFRADLKGQSLAGRVVDGTLKPFATRAEIDGGALAARGLELLWLSDPVDAFFLHVQGSGRVRLPDGSVRRVGFAASNGQPFYGIARALIDQGALARDGASMQAVRSWLKGHPADAPAMMQRNRRYIFFREIDGDGPVGAQGVALTPLRSLAVDASLLPLGAPIWLDTTWPPGSPDAGQAMRRLMIAQDTGAAITGVVRGDVFWGTGEAALARAGGMKQTGRYYLLLPRAVVDRRTKTS